MKKPTKVIIAIFTLTFVIAAGLIATQSYFNNKELKLASDGCYEIGGLPKVKQDPLALNYTFSCEQTTE